jgi:hypothetical protein
VGAGAPSQAPSGGLGGGGGGLGEARQASRCLHSSAGSPHTCATGLFSAGACSACWAAGAAVRAHPVVHAVPPPGTPPPPGTLAQGASSRFTLDISIRSDNGSPVMSITAGAADGTTSQHEFLLPQGVQPPVERTWRELCFCCAL